MEGGPMMEVHGVTPIGKDPSRQPRKRRKPRDQHESQPGGPTPPRVSKRLAPDSKSLILDLEA